MLFLSFLARLALGASILPWVIRAKAAPGRSNPAEREPVVTVTVPLLRVEGSSRKAAGSPADFKSSATALAARSVPASTAQARPWDSREDRSSASSSAPPPHTGSCRAVMFTRALVGTS